MPDWKFEAKARRSNYVFWRPFTPHDLWGSRKYRRSINKKHFKADRKFYCIWHLSFPTLEQKERNPLKQNLSIFFADCLIIWHLIWLTSFFALVNVWFHQKLVGPHNKVSSSFIQTVNWFEKLKKPTFFAHLMKFVCLVSPQNPNNDNLFVKKSRKDILSGGPVEIRSRISQVKNYL